MKILVYGINYYPELTGIGKYTAEMCDWFAKNGHNVEVITGMPFYPAWKMDDKYKGKLFRTEIINKVKVRRSILYVPANVTTKNRIFHELSFLFTSFFHWLKSFFTRYDCVITICPPLSIGVLPLIYQMLHPKTPFIYHIQDLQVDAAKKLNLIKQNNLLNFLSKVEKFILKKATLVTSISDGMKKISWKKT